MGEIKATKPQFIHLRAHSAYSLSEGAIKVKELVELAADNCMPAIAISDSGNLFGALEFSQAAIEVGVQPIIAVEVNFCLEHKDENSEPVTGKSVLIAKNEIGYYNLLKLVSRSYLEAEDQSFPILYKEYLSENLAKGIIFLTGGNNGLLNKAIINGNQKQKSKIVDTLLLLFGDNLYIEINRFGTEEEAVTEPELLRIAFDKNIALVATNNVMFADFSMYEAQDILMCIAGGNYVSDANRKRYSKEHYFKSQEQMCALFSDIPEAVENTVEIAKRCAVLSPARSAMLPNMEVEGNTEEEELRRIAQEGLEERLQDVVFRQAIRDKEVGEENTQVTLTKEEKEAIAKPYRERLEFELDVICQMGFSGYFLIVSDFISWAKEQDIPVGPGRGSGAGSVVAWVMLITDLDPLRYGLLFERFLNPERVSMPDFDIDFCQDRREEVIRYVQQKYGHDRVAQIITFGKLQAKAVLRDVGRVLQMPYSQVDKMCKLIPFNPANPITLQEAIDLDPTFKQEAKNDEQVAKLLEIGLKLEGMFRHAGTHAAGVVIGAQPLDELVPLYRDPRTPLPATQFSMKYAEMAGLVKFDFLGLKTLTTISNICKLIRQQGQEIDINHIPLDDKATFEMLGRGESTGVFQMESAGMRDALRKMKPDTIEDLIALISLYRPGPMENIPTYIARKHGRERPDYLHPKLEPCLKETFGVIIYQEQVMEIAKVLAGYSLGGADLLRRAMGKKIASEMDQQRALFMEGAKKNGVDPKQAGKIFDLVAKFAGYGFNKSHAAAYAWIGYQTAYLKANYPVEFLAGSMNIDIGDTDKLSIFAREAAYNKITLLQPDINKSVAEFGVEATEDGANAIRYGLAGLKGVGKEAMDLMVAERTSGKEFSDIFDMARRCGNKIINKRQIESLAKAGAFDGFGLSRRAVFEGAPSLVRYSQMIAEEKQSNQSNLFGGATEDTSITTSGILPELEEWEDAEKYQQEYHAVGFYLTGHPLEAYRKEIINIPTLIYANQMEEKISMDGGKYKICAITTAITMRSSKRGRFAYLHVSDPTGDVELSIFDEKTIDENIENFNNGVPLLLSVDARRDEGGIRLQVDNIEILDKYLKNKKISISLDINEGAKITGKDLMQISSLIENNDKGRAQIAFVYVTDAHIKTTVKLPGYYTLPAEYESAFSAIEYVKSVVIN